MLVVKNKNCSPAYARRMENFPGLMDQFFGREFNQLFGNDFQKQVPGVNIKETDSAFVLEVAVPGLTKEDLNIQLDKQILTVSAEKKTENGDKADNYLKKEFSYYSFKRQFTVPENVDTAGIKAGYENGILYITLPKKEKKEDGSLKTITIG